MANKQISVNVGKQHHNSGRTINVYTSYANALAHGATGLATIQAINPLDGTEGDAISQVAKTTGLVADQNGFIHFFAAEDVIYYLMSDDLWGLPRKILTTDS